jgi:hypothetical protein
MLTLFAFHCAFAWRRSSSVIAVFLGCHEARLLGWLVTAMMVTTLSFGYDYIIPHIVTFAACMYIRLRG